MRSIHLNGSVYRFNELSWHEIHSLERLTGGRKEIYSKLNEVIEGIRLVGYVMSLTSLGTVRNLPSASAFWKQTPLCVFKTRRKCKDCHLTMKIAQNRFHRFKGGSCSYSDYL
ncbi:Pentatricopeptide repeat-containing protein [Raphanus sativus]|nr:Pentatricopeptide repeat-containing protein [Raphanus sativus]